MLVKVKRHTGLTESSVEEFIINSIVPDDDRLDSNFHAESYSIEYLDNLCKSHAALISILAGKGLLEEADLVKLNKSVTHCANLDLDLVKESNSCF